MNTFLQNRKLDTWTFASVDAWSRPWPATLVGSPTYRDTRRNGVVRVGTMLIAGLEWRPADALDQSEDRAKLNTSFTERLNLTIRQGCADLRRRSPCHARKKRTLDDHLGLFRCIYNFVRPHRALWFGNVTRTPAMLAGLAKKRLSIRGSFALHNVAARLAVVRFSGVM